MRSVRLLCLVLLVLAGLVSSTHAAGRGEPGEVFVVRVELRDAKADLQLMNELKLDVDAVFPGWARVYVLAEELAKLQNLGFRTSLVPLDELRAPDEEELAGPPTAAEAGSIPAAYHTYETLTSELQAIRDANPGIVRLYDIGTSVQGRTLWMMQITDNPDVDEDEPEFAYISSMHGDEVVGKELCIGLIHHLVDNYGTDSRVTNLVDDTEIWIMPSMNPDGTALGQRYNANGFDLNRSFPDWFADPVNSPDGRQAEVRAVMLWTLGRTINQAANFHGGTLVANYPFDNNDAGASVFSPTADPAHPAFVSISRTYADNNPAMYASNSPPYDHGVTNGADWYAITGGMQDWAYTWYGTSEVTLEVSTIKWPSASSLPSFWNDNLESMLSYMERVHEGVRGLVTDAATGAPVRAEVRLDADPFATYTDPVAGDYHRIVMPGSYTMHVTALGYEPLDVPIDVLAGPAARYDVALTPYPADLQPVDSRVEDGGGNGYFDPAETADLAVTLQNFGLLATSVQARLVPTGWFTTIGRSESTYPDLSPGQSGESAAPGYEVEVAADVPAGYKLGFAIDWSAAQGSGISEPFFLDVGGPDCESLAATDVPQTILDYSTVNSDVVVTSGDAVDDVRVAVDISHTYIGDLDVTLISPSGTEVLLHNHTGGGTNDIVGTYGVDLTPAEALSAFVGEPAGGTWRLQVHDGAGGDTGSLDAWTLELCSRVDAATPEMRLREVQLADGGVTFHWWPYPGLLSYRVYRSTDATNGASFVDVTSADGDPTDTAFTEASGGDPLVFYLVTGVGPKGEGAKGHYGE